MAQPNNFLFVNNPPRPLSQLSSEHLASQTHTNVCLNVGYAPEGGCSHLEAKSWVTLILQALTISNRLGFTQLFIHCPEPHLRRGVTAPVATCF